MARFKFAKVHQNNGETIDVFYNRILKIARQCEFQDMDDRIIDSIIFGTNCVKAQDKLLQCEGVRQVIADSQNSHLTTMPISS